MDLVEDGAHRLGETVVVLDQQHRVLAELDSFTLHIRVEQVIVAERYDPTGEAVTSGPPAYPRAARRP